MQLAGSFSFIKFGLISSYIKKKNSSKSSRNKEERKARMQRPTHGQYEEADPHHAGLDSVAEGEGDGGGEKKSVLKKVKDKAKKIKETIKKHSHGHDHDNEPEHGSDEDTEIVDDPEVHGAPMYDSTVIPSTNLPKQVDMNLEKPTDPRDDRYDHKVRDETYPKVRHDGISGPVGLVEPLSEFPTRTHMPATKDTVPHNRVRAKPDDEYLKSHISPIGGLDPHASGTCPEQVPISNYESKVSDPTGQGGGEARVDTLIRQLQDLDVRGHELESKPKPEQVSYTGSHDQFAPKTTPTKDELTNSPKRVDMANPDQSMPQDTVAGKISSATSAITKRAVSAKNVVASKLGYGEAPNQLSTIEKLTPVYEKVAGAGTAVVSTVTGSGGSEGRVGEKGSDKGVSVKEYWTEKLLPGDEDRALSEAITEALQKKKEAGAAGNPVMGKVTESDEVRDRLGTGKENQREGEDALTAGSEGVGSGLGMADRLKGAVSSWIGKSAGIQTAQNAVGQSYVSGSGSGPRV